MGAYKHVVPDYSHNQSKLSHTHVKLSIESLTTCICCQVWLELMLSHRQSVRLHIPCQKLGAVHAMPTSLVQYHCCRSIHGQLKPHIPLISALLFHTLQVCICTCNSSFTLHTAQMLSCNTPYSGQIQSQQQAALLEHRKCSMYW